MRAITASGCEASEAWLAVSVTTFFAFKRPDIQLWLAGAIIRSSLEIWYQDGFFFQAGLVIASWKVPASGAFCVAAMTSASSAGRSWQKLS